MTERSGGTGDQPPPDGGYGQYGQQYGQYGQYGQVPPPPADGYGQYGTPSGAYYGGGFVPVPTAFQPGIIPLRPLTLGEIYDGAFRAIRANPKVMFGLALLVVAGGAVLQLAFLLLFARQVEQATASELAELDAVFGVGSLVGLMLTAVVTYFATFIVNGLAIVSVGDSVVGRTISLRDLWQRSRGQVWRLVGLVLVLGVATFLAVVVVVALIGVVTTVLISALGESALWLLLLLPVVMLAVLVGFAFLTIRLALATCVIMLERTGIFTALGRSWRLTKGHFWRLLGILLLTALIMSVLTSVLAVPFSMLGSVFAAENVTAFAVLSSVGQLAGSTLSIPVMAAVLALLYIDVRMRTEGLDVELARASQEP